MIITKTEIRDLAFYANFDTADIRDTYINIAQENTLKPILRDKLYAQVIGGSPTADIVTLRDTYCKPLVAFAVKSMVIASTSPRPTNVGAGYATVPNTAPSADATDDALNVNDQLVAQLRQRLITYLRDNDETYAFEEFQSNREFITNKIFIP